MPICKECEQSGTHFESPDLTNHIEKNHGLVNYFKKFDTEEAEALVIDRKVIDMIDKLDKKIEISGVAFKKRKTNEFEKAWLQKINTAYHFPKITPHICLDILENKRVMLVGETGCGKTSLINQIASRINQPVIRVNCNGQMSVSDLIGFYSAQAGTMSWIDGVLPIAMRNGFWIIFDEIDFADTQLLACINAVLEEGGSLLLKEKGNEVVSPHPDFRIFATGNTIGCMAHRRHAYQGTNLLNAAFLDRWRVYHIPYLKPEEEEKVLIDTILQKQNKQISSAIAGRFVFVANMVREAFDKEEIQTGFSTRLLIDWVEMTIRKHPSLEKNKDRLALQAAQTMLFSKISKEDSEVISGIISRAFGGKSDV